MTIQSKIFNFHSTNHIHNFFMISTISEPIAAVLVTLRTILFVMLLNMEDASKCEWQSHNILNGIVSRFGAFEGLGGFSIRDISE